MGKVADFQMYVGRTHPDTTEDDIKQLVKQLTASDGNDGVELTSVELLKEMKDESERVTSKCWKVIFPDGDKEVMMKESSWPRGWTYRRFYPGRPQQQKKDIPLYKAEVTPP